MRAGHTTSGRPCPNVRSLRWMRFSVDRSAYENPAGLRQPPPMAGSSPWTVPLLGLTLVADLSQVAGSVGELCHELVEYPVERTHGDGGRRARELWTCVWLVDIGHGGQAPQATPRPSVVHPG